MDPGKALEHAQVDGTMLEWLTVHGNLCLALRHPQNDGASRAQALAMIHRLSRLLVEKGILTAEEMNMATRYEQQHWGMERFV